MRPFRFAAQISNAPTGDDWRAKARRLEDLGYSSLLMPDHFSDQLAPVPALMAAADATSEIHVGTLVFDNDYKHPLILAKECATIDVLSNGRLELGIGAGWMSTDYEQSGIPEDRPGVRIDRMVEGIQVMKGCFSGEEFSFSGEHYTITKHTGTPKPIQQPHPPFIIGGGGKRVLSVAAREADIISVNFTMVGGSVNPKSMATGSAEATAEKIDWIRDAAGSRFDDIELAITIFAAIITDDPDSMAKGLGGSFGMEPDVIARVPHVLFGPVEAMIDELQRRREEYGFSYIAFSGGSEEAMAPVVAKLAGT